MTKPINPTKGQNSAGSKQIKFSVCAVIDLLGFSSHLEISGYDLRTAIGEQATSRLQILETAIELLREEQSRPGQYHPKGLHIQRINDAIVIAMDLDDILVPSVGNTTFRGLSAEALKDFFTPEQMEDERSFDSQYHARMQTAIEPLEQFLGLVARIHLFVRKREGDGLYPGAKTVVATGFRKPFISATKGEDVLSANFAFANVMVAEKELGGPHFFVDNNIVELLADDKFAKNLLRLSHFHWMDVPFDCLADDANSAGHQPNAEVPQAKEVSLFRRRYWFRRLNPAPLSYLHQLPGLGSFLRLSVQPDRSNRFYAHVYDAIFYGLSKRMILDSRPPRSFVYNGTNDLDTAIEAFEEFLATGESRTQALRQKRKRRAELGLAELPEDSQLAKELDALEQKEVDVDLPQVSIRELGDLVWSLSEEHFTPLLYLFSEDLELLEYPRES